jgi:hypothetical protein
MSDNKIIPQPEYDALYAFDQENNIEPASVIAERVAAKHGYHDKHPIVDDIHYAIEDALELGQKRGRLIPQLCDAGCGAPPCSRHPALAATPPSGSAIECGARAIASSQGHDPDDLAPLTTMCTSDNQRVAWWKVFEEEAEACLGTIKAVLREHWLTGIVCDHEAKTDRATCSCSVWRCEPLPSVGAAVDAWINHVLCPVSRPNPRAPLSDT